MSILLDTHAALWLLGGDSRLGRRVAELVLETVAKEEVAISDIVLLETSMLISKGRMAIRGKKAAFLHELGARFRVLSINPDIAARAMEIKLPHGDPFDRVIVATALHYGFPLCTRDAEITRSRLVPVVW